MLPRPLRKVLVGGFLLMGVCSAQAQTTTVLYDGSSDKKPNESPWNWLFFAPGVTVTAPGGSGATTFDSTSSASYKGGYTLTTSTALDRLAGYTLRFDVRVTQEDHSPASADKNSDGLADRAGFSLIVISSDKKGLELGFWQNEIWPQSDDPLFIHDPDAERAFFDTTAGGAGQSGLLRFDLQVLGSSYDLFTVAANGGANPILSGSLRDYTAAPISFPNPNPYIVPNLLFFGDDTTSASAAFKMSYVSLRSGLIVNPAPGSVGIVAVPEPACLTFLASLSTLGAISLLCRRRPG